MSAAPSVALFLPTLEGGGAERVFVELANAFAARGCRVDLALASAQGPYLADVSRPVRVVDFGVRRVSSALPALARHLRSERPHAILSGLDHANVVAILARRLAGGRTRAVVSVRSVPSEVYRRANSPASRLLLRVMRVAYRYADAIVANSGAVAVDLARLLRTSTDGIHVIHNPVNLAEIERLSREAVDHPWTADGAMPVVIGVGSLAPLKDFTTLILAFAAVRARRECRLVILGEGPEREALMGVARRAGVDEDVLMPGFQANPFAWMRRAAVFVSSSVTEGCPNALMQALALGMPIVSTDSVGGSAELLEHGRWGKLVPAGSPSTMADAIDECLSSGPIAGTRGRAADFSHERIADRYLDVLLPARGMQVVAGVTRASLDSPPADRGEARNS